MTNIKNLARELALRGQTAETGFVFEVTPIPGDVDILRISVEDREELPIFVSVTEEQIICISYLFHEDEVKADKVAEMNNAMLLTNITIPLSSFAKLDRQYVIYGSLSVHSGMYEITHELQILSSNILEALEAMKDYLK